MKKFPHAVTAERQAGGEIDQNDEPKADIERFDDGAARQEGRHDNEGDGDEVKGQQAVAEPVRADALALVKVAEGLQTVGRATLR